MVQTSVDICNNVNLDQEMCLRRGETRVAQTKMHNLKFGTAVPPPPLSVLPLACYCPYYAGILV